MGKVVVFCFILFTSELFSQNDTTKKGEWSISGLVDAYYSYQFSNPSQALKPDFFYNYKRNNTVDINLALVKVNYSESNLRCNIGLMAGSYAEYNLASESPLAQKIYEANAGIKLSKKNDLWLDVGVLPSHIGLEGILANDNIALSRSITAENSPYFETGARLSYTNKNKKWYLAALVLNGWQRIRKVTGSNLVSFGTQAIYEVNEYHTLNSSTFIGSDRADSIKSFRYFHGFYWQYRKHKLISQFTFDVGLENNQRSKKQQTWYGTNWLVKYNAFQKLSVTGRAEYYNDYNHVLIPNSVKDALAGSLGVEYRIYDNACVRFEGRGLSSVNDFYNQYFDRFNTQIFLTTGLSVWF